MKKEEKVQKKLTKKGKHTGITIKCLLTPKRWSIPRENILNTAYTTMHAYTFTCGEPIVSMHTHMAITIRPARPVPFLCYFFIDFYMFLHPYFSILTEKMI